jgi:anhydro-N-acetylmuramic acid kinase
MSGMSADGLDVALVRIGDRPPAPGRRADLLRFETVPYEPALSARIRAAARGTTREVCVLSFDLALRWAADVLRLLDGWGTRPADVDFLASHGQTLDHVPRGSLATPSTLQVGDGCVLAERTGILTVSDFRPRDLAAGGEGAPLVPMADWLLYAREGETSARHNLGNVANVTVVTPRREDVLAFDTGPANALIDAFARLVPGAPGGIDRDGAVSAAGRLDAGAAAALREGLRDFRDRPPPKSAGYDAFGADLVARARAAGRGRPEDLVRTAVVVTAECLDDAYARHVLPRFPALREVVFSGGGARNPTLMGLASERLGARGLRVAALPPPMVDAKEAVAFALLGDLTLSGEPGNLPSATGAGRAVLLGKISG